MKIGSYQAMGSGGATGPQDDDHYDEERVPTCDECGAYMESTADGWACNEHGLAKEEAQ